MNTLLKHINLKLDRLSYRYAGLFSGMALQAQSQHAHLNAQAKAQLATQMISQSQQQAAQSYANAAMRQAAAQSYASSMQQALYGPNKPIKFFTGISSLFGIAAPTKTLNMGMGALGVSSQLGAMMRKGSLWSVVITGEHHRYSVELTDA